MQTLSAFYNALVVYLREAHPVISQPDETMLYYRLIEKIGEGGMGVICRRRRSAKSCCAYREPACLASSKIFSPVAT